MCREFVNAVSSRVSRAAALSVLAIFLGTGGIARGQLIIPGADGSDGALTPTGSIEIHLSEAINRDWDQPSPVPGSGVYDHTKWAVVFKYTDVNIPSGVTVTFKNHPSGAPVVWLVSGDVTIDGTVSLVGKTGSLTHATQAQGGPGGFRGGKMRQQYSAFGAGFGPGGGGGENKGGGYSTCGGNNCADTWEGRSYGNDASLPLIGGSGGAGGPRAQLWGATGGGGGGGAILIASSQSITLGGLIDAGGGHGPLVWSPNGYYNGGGGSAGAIRLIADQISGSGRLRAIGGRGATSGGAGRIRVEANQTIGIADLGDPPWVGGVVQGGVAQLWPLTAAPRVRITSVDGVPVSTDPRANLDFPDADATVSNTGSVQILIEAAFVPSDWVVEVFLTAKNGGARETTIAEQISGDDVQSTWAAETTLPPGFAAIQVRAYDPT